MIMEYNMKKTIKEGKRGIDNGRVSKSRKHEVFNHYWELTKTKYGVCGGKKTHSYIYYLKITQSKIREYIINKIEKDYKFI